MRIRLFLSLICALGLLTASSALAGALTAATWTSTIQGQSLSVMSTSGTCSDDNPETVQDMIIACPTAGLTPTGNGTATTYSVSLTMPLFEFSQFTTTGAIPVATHATVKQTTKAQVVTGDNSMATGIPGVGGYVTVKTAAHTKLSGLAPGMSTLVKVPLSVGQKGQFTDYFIVIGVLHYITVDFYAWTPHTVALTNLTSKDAPGSPNGATKVTAIGSFMLDAAGNGTVSLVSPSLVTIAGCPNSAAGPDCPGQTGLADRKSASFTTLKLTYGGGVPEPGTLLLLGAGVAGLVLVGSRKHS